VPDLRAGGWPEGNLWTRSPAGESELRGRLTLTASARLLLVFGVPLRLILDNNVWSYVAEQGAVQELDEWLLTQHAHLVTPPSILLEALRRPDPALRLRTVRAMAHGPRRIRCLTEAALESREMIDFVRLHRPQWLLDRPDMRSWYRHANFWQRKVWQRAVNGDDRIHAKERELATQRGSLLPALKEEKRLLREVGHDPGQLDRWALTSVDPVLLDGRVAWDGKPTHAWRLELADQWSEALCEQEARVPPGSAQTYRDWASCYLNTATLARERHAFVELWIRNVQPYNVPRSWLRSSLRLAQASQKIEDGNLADNQHSSYLLDADVFVTADKRFARSLKVVRTQAPFRMADVALVRPTESIVAAIDSAVAAVCADQPASC
jgi:hypothetical protein